MTETPRPQPLTTSCDSGALRGSVEPRLWTRPLRELTPDTSYGYDVIDFAREVLRRPLDPWQCWLLIHACELLPDGRPRFRRVVVVVARQNGKTEIAVVLAAFWLFVDAQPMTLGIGAKLQYARYTWAKTVRLVNRARVLDRQHARRWTRTTNGEVAAWTTEDAHYVIAAANEDAGRTLTVHRLLLDELRTHHDYACWDAATGATSAVDDAQVWALSNAGTDRSIVLHDLRDAATEGGDPDLGWFEWSAPDGARTDDPVALAAANPDYGGRTRPDALLAEARAAERAGGEKLAGFRTERLCLSVRTLNPAVDPAGWRDCAGAVDLAPVRTRVACCVDLAPDGQHAVLTAAAPLPDGRVGLDVVAAWAGSDAVDRCRRELAAIVRRVRPRVLGWFPSGPAAEFAADLAARPGWPPRGITVQPIRDDAPAACMALASLVRARRILHGSDPLQDAHVLAAEPLAVGDRWVFSRRGRGHVNAAYAAAGAVQLARGLPPSPGRPRVVVVND